MPHTATTTFPDTRRSRASLALFAAGALALAGCSLDELTSTSPTSEPTSEPSSSATKGTDADPSPPTSEFAVTPDTDNGSTASPGSSTTTEAPATLPDVVGQIDTKAEEVLLAAGLTDIQIVEEPGFGAAGEVIKQQPPAGSAATGTVTLTVRGELPAMPNYVATSSDDAIEELESWGVETSVQTTIDKTRPAGEVLATVPAAGAQIGQIVELTVAGQPVTLPLGTSETPRVDSYYGRQTRSGPRSSLSDDIVEMDGDPTVKAITIFYPGSDRYERQASTVDRPTYLDYQLGRDWTSFRTTIGFGDQSQDFAQGVFRVYVDGELRKEVYLGIGETVDLDVDVTNALRLKLEIEPKIVSKAYYVWDNPVVVGAGAGTGTETDLDAGTDTAG